MHASVLQVIADALSMRIFPDAAQVLLLKPLQFATCSHTRTKSDKAKQRSPSNQSKTKKKPNKVEKIELHKQIKQTDKVKVKQTKEVK